MLTEKNCSLRVDLLCTGLDRIRRGYESFARECFDALKDFDGLDIRLYKGDGSKVPGEQALSCLPREYAVSKLLGWATGRSAYHVEQLTFLLSYIAGPLRLNPPQVVFTSDANLANFLSRWRKRSGAGYRILFSNGGPTSPPFPEYDHVQQVAMPYYDQALAAGEAVSTQSLVPYGIHLPEYLKGGNFLDRDVSRRKLGLPTDKKILLSVGYVSATHKRMDHVVKEVALLPPTERPFLVLLGQQDGSTNEVRSLATELLGPSGFLIDSVSYDQVSIYYAAADCFVLASLKEGFGRVLLEASMFGLSCVVDENAVMHYVLGEVGCFVDMAKPGALADQLKCKITWESTSSAKLRRQAHVRDRYSWATLIPEYMRMFRCAAGEAI